MPDDSPNKVTLYEPQAWEAVDWTSRDVKSAWAEAQLGNLQPAADLCELVMQDERVKVALSVRNSALFRRDNLSFEPGADRRRTSVITALAEDWPAIAPEATLKDVVSWSLFLGVCPVQKVWGWSEETGRDLPRLVKWSPRWLRFDWQKRLWVLLVQAPGGAVVERIVEKRDREFWLHFHEGEHRPWTRGLWWSVCVWWLAKQYAIADWASYNRAAGTPIPKGKAPKELKEDARDKWRKQLAGLKRGQAVVLPEGFDVEYLLAPTAQYKTFLEKLAVANRGMSTAIQGGNLTSEVDSGSLAAAEVHERRLYELVSCDAEVLSTSARAGVCEDWALSNFGARALAPYPLWDTQPPEDAVKVADKLKKVGEGVETANRSLAPYGLEVDAEAVFKGARIPIRVRPERPAPEAPPAASSQESPP